MPKFHNKISISTIPIFNVMVGVAGHIDHGKTELVKMLTGCDTDRLKEEKERGMSIELGFAPCFVESGRFGIVDVPGHERFVRKMVAGATGIDMALLVIAADDGVMPQTREHLDILELLGIRHLLIALNKIDLVSPERAEEAQREIQFFLQTTPFRNAPIVPVSALTGEGLDVLRKRLQESVEAINRRKTDGVFRMAVDRIFTAPGHGTIITGIASSGTVRVGDFVEILPLGKTGRVRGLQVFLSDSREAVAGQCVALNLTSIHPSEVERGFVAAAPGRFGAHESFTVYLKASRFLETSLSNSARVHFHTGASETVGKIRLLEDDRLEAEKETFAQIVLEKPVCAFIRDRFILRMPSPANTVAGGAILETSPLRLRRNDGVILERLTTRWQALESPEELILSLLNDSPLLPKSLDELSRMAGLQTGETQAALDELKNRSSIIHKSESFIVSVKGFMQTCEIVLQCIQQLHREQPLRFAFSFADIVNRLKQNTPLVQEALIRLVDEGKIVCRENAYRWTNAPSLDPKLIALAETLEAILRQERFHTSSLRELAEHLRKPINAIDSALRVLVESGKVKRLADGVFLHDEHVQWAKNQLVDTLRREGSFETHLFKNIIGSSRKYAIPLLDYFDSIGLTRREGGVRVLCEKKS